MCKNKIELDFGKGHISINTNYRISVLSENSGVGKTYVVYAIEQAKKIASYLPMTVQKDGKAVDVYTVSDSTDRNKAEEILKYKDSIIIVDEADRVFGMYPEFVDLVNQNEKASFILFLRSAPRGLYISQNWYLKFSRKGYDIEIKPFDNLKKIQKFFSEEGLVT